jgi:PAS domain S-box-containing protein
MNKKHDKSQEPGDLRKRAKAMLASDPDGGLSPEEASEALEDLRTHQIELELQNEELRLAQEELVASRDRYSGLYDFSPVGYVTINGKGMIVEANLTLASMLGVVRSDLVNAPLSAFIVDEDQDTYYCHRRELLETRRRRICELRLHKDQDSAFWVRLEGIAYDDPDEHIRLAIVDIRESKQVQGRQKLAVDILKILAQPNRTTDIIGDLLQLVKASTGVEAAGVRLRQGDDYPYYVQNGFPDACVQRENSLCARGPDSQIVRNADGEPLLECMCGSILQERIDPSKPFFTEGGSFWTNSTTQLLALTTDADRSVNARNYCNTAGYESVALIPIRSGDETIGLLQLNDHRVGCFTSEMIDFFEGICMSIGIALARRRAKEDILNLARFPAENSDPVLRIAADGTLLYANAASEFLLAEWRCKVGQTAPESWRNAAAEVLVSGSARRVEADCAQRILSFMVTPVAEAGYVNLYARDITDRKLAEREITNLAKFPSENPNPVLRLAGDGTVLYHNAPSDALLKAWGWKEDRPLGGRWSKLVADVLHADKARVEESDHDGRTYALTFSPVAESGYVNVYALDVTDRKLAEEAAREAQAQLLAEQQAVQRRIETELAALREELVRTTRLAAIGQVSGSIAHDLRNPLGSVRNAAYYLKQIIPGDDSEIIEYLGIIDQEITSADRIITNLLRIGRNPKAVKQEVDIAKAVVESFDRIGSPAGVRLHVSANPDPFIILADPDQLRQVFDNLGANAVQAMGDNGEITVEATRDRENDTIKFCDTGPGITQEIRQTLFQPLVTTKAKGTGLGLTICRQIAQRHGGTIGFVDGDGGGATFVICLPRDTHQTSGDTEN